jgi:hypothetical protein
VSYLVVLAYDVDGSRAMDWLSKAVGVTLYVVGVAFIAAAVAAAIALIAAIVLGIISVATLRIRSTVT